MQTKLNLRKVLALGATLAMLATSALASSTSSWPVYGGNANHNSVVSGAPTSIATGYPHQHHRLGRRGQRARHADRGRRDLRLCAL